MTSEKFRPSFTTSAKAAEERSEGRSAFFGDNVRVTEGKRPPSGLREKKAPTLQPYPSMLNRTKQGHIPTDNSPESFKLKNEEPTKPSVEPKGKFFWQGDEPQ